MNFEQMPKKPTRVLSVIFQTWYCFESKLIKYLIFFSHLELHKILYLVSPIVFVLLDTNCKPIVYYHQH